MKTIFTLFISALSLSACKKEKVATYTCSCHEQTTSLFGGGIDTTTTFQITDTRTNASNKCSNTSSQNSTVFSSKTCNLL